MALRGLAILLAVSGLLLAAGSAHAARTVPQGFFGMMWDGDVSVSPPEVQEREWGRMATAGVEAVRTSFFWSTAQPVRGGPIDHGRTDAVVNFAASHGLDLLPVVDYAPVWARAYRTRSTSPPRDPARYAAYLASLIDRYGPRGSFWDENPYLPRRPIREWQIWNEPHLRTYWDAPRRSRFGHPHYYVRLLRLAYRTVKRRDPGAKVVLAGLTQLAWNELTLLYRRGGKRFFDVAALQTFPLTAARAVRATRLFRQAMNRAGDRRKPLYITEITWPASRGRTRGIPFQRQETPRGMARRLSQAYAALVRVRRRFGLRRVYWYTWASKYGRGGSIFNYAGLFRYAGGRSTAQPALGAYQRSARRFEGCVKDERADCR